VSEHPSPQGTPWGCILFSGGGLLVITALLFTGIGWMIGTTMMPEDPVIEIGAFDPGSDYVPVSIHGLSPDIAGGGVHMELLAEDGRVLPMLIGQAEGDAIRLAADGVPVPRPMTHDLALLLVDGLGGQLQAVTVSKLEYETFHATLVVERADGTLVQVDSRSSDAVALALRASAPIYAHEDVLQAAAF